MSITIVVCTYNRCETLAKALNSLVASTVPRAVEWEILVVDNNSTDGTPAVVEGFCQRFPGRFRYIMEPRQGLSHARNAGIRESRSSVLAFTDDDVIVEPSWLWNLTAGLFTGAWAGAGGRIIPQWNCPIPRWLSAEHAYSSGAFVAFNPNAEPGPLSEPPFGANMAFRKEAFEKHGGFRTDLGRSAGKMLSGEDTEFGQRLISAGERLRYEPSAIVHHPVPENRVTKDYQLAWCFGAARSVIRVAGVDQGTKWFLGGVPLYMFRRLARWTAQWMISIKPAKRFHHKLKVWSVAGQIFESYQQSREAKVPQLAVGQR